MSSKYFDDKFTDEQRIAWAKVSLMLEKHGDGPIYRAAWQKWENLAFEKMAQRNNQI